MADQVGHDGRGSGMTVEMADQVGHDGKSGRE